jgi:hypothetical protein
MEPTKEEAAFIKKLQKLMDECPKSLWFFSGASTCNMSVMKYKGFTSKGHGIRAVRESEGMDQDYCVGEIIGPEFEGGDW